MIPDRIGRYRVVGLLGAGAQASVYRGHDDELDADVAIKVLSDNLSLREEWVSSFLREARLLRTIVDTRVVATHDVGTLDSGQPYLVMDLVGDGETLAARAAEHEAAGRRVSDEDIVAAGRELAAGLAAVEAHGVVHGDVKPENVFIGPGGDVGVGPTPPSALLAAGETLVLGDFGIAATAGTAGSGAGTTGYAAPEVVAGGVVDARSDLFSAAAVLYRLLCGAPPPSPCDPATLPARLPLRRFFAAALAADPGSRPQNAVEFTAALESAATPASGKRRWLVAAAAAAVIVGAAAALALASRGPEVEHPEGLGAGGGEAVLVADPAARAVFSARKGNVDTVASDLGNPVAVAAGGDGAVFVADREGNRVLEVRPGRGATVIAGTGEAGDDGDGGPAVRARLNHPSGVAVLSDGSVLVSDTGNHKIRRVGQGGGISTFAGTGSAGSGGDGGPATEGTLVTPAGLSAATDGAVLVADPGANRVRRVSTAGYLSTVAGSGSSGYSGDGGSALDAGLAAPAAVTFDRDGTVLIADTANNRIRRVDGGGTISTVAAGLDSPAGVAVTEAGETVASDTGSGKLVVVHPDGSVSPWG